MRMGTRVLAGIATVIVAAVAELPGAACAQAQAAAEFLVLRGRGMKGRSSGRFYLLGRNEPASRSWKTLPGAPNIEYKTASGDRPGDRVIILRCNASCTTEPGVTTGAPKTEVERWYGSPRRTEPLEGGETFLVYDGIGFSVTASRVTRIYVFPYL